LYFEFIIVFDAIRAKSIIKEVKRHIRAEKLSKPNDKAAFSPGSISKGSFFINPKVEVSGFRKSVKNIV